MVIEKFLVWAQSASPEARAEGVYSLAQAYLYADLSGADRRMAEVSMTAMLDDPNTCVRQAMSEALASALDAPRHVVVALANDHSSIACPLLKRSPLLSDSDLIDCASMGDAIAQSAIAMRPDLSSFVCAALAEIGGREAVITMAVNDAADISEGSLLRIADRFQQDAEVREALLLRSDLTPAVRTVLVTAAAKALSDFVATCGWIAPERAERVTRDAREKATILIAADASADGLTGDGCLSSRHLVAHLRKSGQLTAGLVLRALLSGNRSLFEAALCELTGLPATRVGGLVAHWRGTGFEAIYQKAHLPEALLPAFRAAISALHEIGPWTKDDASARLSRPLIDHVLAACAEMRGAQAGKLLALLRRFEAEAAREEARDMVQSLVAESLMAESLVAQFSAEPEDMLDLAPHVELDLMVVAAEDSVAALDHAPPVEIFNDSMENESSAAPTFPDYLFADFELRERIAA